MDSPYTPLRKLLGFFLMPLRSKTAVGASEGSQASSIVRSASITSIVPSRGQVCETPLSRSKSEVTNLCRSTCTRIRKVTSRYAGVAGQVFEQDFLSAFSKVDDGGVRSKRDAANLLHTIRANFVCPSEQWEKRVDALVIMRSLVMNPISLEEFWADCKPLELKLRYCLKSLRSQLVREACITIAFLAVRLRTKFNRFAEGLLPDLLSLVQNHAKVVSSSASLASEFIIKHTQSSKLLPILIMCFESKSREIRSACCNLLLVLIQHWTRDELKKQADAISAFITLALGDADPSAREYGREAFIRFKKLFPVEGSALFDKLDAGKKRQLKTIFPGRSSDRIVFSMGNAGEPTVSKPIRKGIASEVGDQSGILTKQNLSAAAMDSAIQKVEARTADIFSGDSKDGSHEQIMYVESVNTREDPANSNALQLSVGTPMPKVLQDITSCSLLRLSMISPPCFDQTECSETSFLDENNIFHSAMLGCAQDGKDFKNLTSKSSCIANASANQEENFCSGSKDLSPLLIKFDDSIAKSSKNSNIVESASPHNHPDQDKQHLISYCLLEQTFPNSHHVEEKSGNADDQSYLFVLNNAVLQPSDQKGVSSVNIKSIEHHVDDLPEQEAKMEDRNLVCQLNKAEENDQSVPVSSYCTFGNGTIEENDSCRDIQRCGVSNDSTGGAICGINKSVDGNEIASVQGHCTFENANKTFHGITAAVDEFAVSPVQSNAQEFHAMVNETASEESASSGSIAWEEAKSNQVNLEFCMPSEADETDSFRTATICISRSNSGISSSAELGLEGQHGTEEALKLILQFKTSNEFRTMNAVVQAILNGCIQDQFSNAALYEIGNALLSAYMNPDCILKNVACVLWANLLCLSRSFREVVLSRSVGYMIVWLRHRGDPAVSLKMSILDELLKRLSDWKNDLNDRAEAAKLLYFIIHNVRSSFFINDQQIANYIVKLVEGAFHDTMVSRWFLVLLLQILSIYPIKMLESISRAHMTESIHEEYTQFLCAYALVTTQSKPVALVGNGIEESRLACSI
uniref:TOG domain-containing protein n=1 Tax=Trichuris muris TaxID=70415 RepID=A0A5S6R160_TRIMR